MISTPQYHNLVNRIFKVKTDDQFTEIAIEVFHHQYENNIIYKQFVDLLGVETSKITCLKEIPFMPIDFFKNHEIISQGLVEEKIFKSSSTTGIGRSNHLVADLAIYNESFIRGFKKFYGDPAEICLIAILPSYVEQGDSSLIYMIDHLIALSNCELSGYYLNKNADVLNCLMALKKQNKRTILWGVTYALLDFIEMGKIEFESLIVLETGGMKGRRMELVREELHEKLCSGFGVGSIHSEYGMTELLSQAYSAGEGKFRCSDTMKILIRDVNDPKSFMKPIRTGGINVVDLANINSCSFIATQDLGKLHNDGSFEVVGRFDNSELRGCNLMVV